MLFNSGKFNLATPCQIGQTPPFVAHPEFELDREGEAIFKRPFGYLKGLIKHNRLVLLDSIE